MLYEYKVVPAPLRAEKQRGARTTEERYAQTLGTLLNQIAREGWEYQRAEALPTEERAGLTKRRSVYVNVLVFRRPLDTAPAAERPALAIGTASLGAAPRLELPSEGKPPRLGPADGE